MNGYEFKNVIFCFVFVTGIIVSIYTLKTVLNSSRSMSILTDNTH